MPLFTIFVVAAVITGAGAMLSPAWQTRQPRIGLSASFLLALLVGGAVFWTELAGWDTLIIDYLLFALVTFVVLGGTLAQAQTRAEALGETLPDADQGWTSRKDLLFLLVAGILFLVPALAIVLPLGDSGTLNAYLSFSVLEGRDFSALLPFHPDITVFHAPGFHGLSSYLSQQLEQSIHSVQIGVGAVAAWLSVWVIYDLGSEIADKRTGRWMALAYIFSTAPLALLINGHYTVLLALLFILSAVICMLRYQRDGLRVDMIAAGLLLGAVLYTNFTLFVLLMLTYVLWVVLLLFVRRTQQAASLQVNPSQILAGLIFGILGVALIGTAPWLLNNLPLLAEFAPGETMFVNPGMMITLTGIFLIPAAIAGITLAWTHQREIWHETVLLCGTWIFVVLFFVIFGVPGAISRFIDADTITWAGMLIPGWILAGIALQWAWSQFTTDEIRAQLYHLSEPAMAICGIVLLAGITLVTPILEFGEDTLDWQQPGATVTQLDAMDWLRENSDPDARILNDPALTWAASVTGRDVINVPLSSGFAPIDDLQADAVFFEALMASPEDSALLQDARIDFVLSQTLLESDALNAVYSDVDVFVYAVR